jgi:2-polyprenyl-3-methyl-5-hydroxy-6-metoxy-1,4-benzoquinol methylase
LACPNHTVLDWGCALGQGLDQLNQSFNNQLLEGYDFSEQAINKARELFPRYKFHNQIPSEKYDFVITSNCLEHFENPMKQLEEIAKLSRNCIIVMTPYNQIITNEVHPVTITEDTFPKSMNGFKKTQTIIVPNVKPELGGGEQILVVYEKIMDGEL